MFARAEGTNASPAAVNSGDTLGAINCVGYNGSAWTNQGGMRLSRGRELSTTANGTRIAFFVVQNTTVPQVYPLNIISSGIGISVNAAALTPLSALDVGGGVAIGSYAGANAAPGNGLIVSGYAGFGLSNPSYSVDVAGVARVSSTIIANGGISANYSFPLTSICAASYSPQLVFTNQASDSTAGYIFLLKGRAGSTTTQSGDQLGSFVFGGFDSANAQVNSAIIGAVTTGAATAGNIPTDVVLYLNNAEKLRLTNAGVLKLAAYGPGTLGTSSSGVVAAGRFVTPQMYGCVGDGVADDTADLSTCFNSGKPIVLIGKFNITGPITVNIGDTGAVGLSIIGGGQNLSQIIFSTATAAITLNVYYGGNNLVSTNPQFVLRDFVNVMAYAGLGAVATFSTTTGIISSGSFSGLWNIIGHAVSGQQMIGYGGNLGKVDNVGFMSNGTGYTSCAMFIQDIRYSTFSNIYVPSGIGSAIGLTNAGIGIVFYSSYQLGGNASNHRTIL